MYTFEKAGSAGHVVQLAFVYCTTMLLLGWQVVDQLCWRLAVRPLLRWTIQSAGLTTHCTTANCTRSSQTLWSASRPCAGA